MAEKMYDLLIIGDNCYHGSPTMFAKIRRALAFAAEIPTEIMRIESEDGDEISLEVPDLSGYDLVEANIYGEWDTPPPDPILYLLAHSDEKGVIQEEHMIPLIARIAELEPIAHEIIEERDGVEAAQLISHRLQRFAEQLAMAYENHRVVEFRLEPVYP